MKYKSVIASVLLLFGSLPVWAQSENYRSSATDLFREREFSIDLFGSISVGQETIDDLTGSRAVDDGRLGAGVGLNYFFTRYIGVGADAYTESTEKTFVDNTSGNLLVRFPIESVRLAPYVFGGGGRQFDPEGLWFGQLGGGLEIRVTEYWALFTDARYMMLEDEADNIGLARFGLRIPF